MRRINIIARWKGRKLKRMDDSLDNNIEEYNISYGHMHFIIDNKRCFDNHACEEISTLNQTKWLANNMFKESDNS